MKKSKKKSKKRIQVFSSVNSAVVPGHADYETLLKIRTALEMEVGNLEVFENEFPDLVRTAIDFVIDPIRTARTRLEELDSVEKTFIGLKIEHFLRDRIGFAKGPRDLRIGEMDVDIKNTVRTTWTIPPETYRTEEPCILVAMAEPNHKCWLGIAVARKSYLTKKDNRDKKRGFSRKALRNIMWLVDGATFPVSRWNGLDMVRFRELRQIVGGNKRVIAFFTENLRKVIHRSVVQGLLFDQMDYMKRLRGNGGAQDELKESGIALLSGAYDQNIVLSLGLASLKSDEWIALMPNGDNEARLMRSLGAIA